MHEKVTDSLRDNFTKIYLNFKWHGIHNKEKPPVMYIIKDYV